MLHGLNIPRCRNERVYLWRISLQQPMLATAPRGTWIMNCEPSSIDVCCHSSFRACTDDVLWQELSNHRVATPHHAHDHILCWSMVCSAYELFTYSISYLITFLLKHIPTPNHIPDPNPSPIPNLLPNSKNKRYYKPKTYHRSNSRTVSSKMASHDHAQTQCSHACT